MRKAALHMAVLSLTACGAVTTHKARTDLIGQPITAVIQCAGLPDKTQRLDPDHGLLEWVYKDSAPALSLSLVLVGKLDIGGGAQCVMDVSFDRAGVVTNARFPACTGTLVRGPDAAATTLVGECLDHPGSATLPAGWDAVAALVSDGQGAKK